MINLIRESEARSHPGRLAELWGATETFAIVPERQGVGEGWISSMANLLPEGLKSGCVLLTTSGSTGSPKLIVGRKHRAVALARALHVLQDSEPVLETIVTLPLSYSYAFVNQWLWAHTHERQLIITEGLADPSSMIKALQRAKAAMLCLVGPQLDLILRYCSGQSFPGIIRLHFAGGAFPSAAFAHIRELFPRAAVFNNYGCAEAMPRISLRMADSRLPSNHVGTPLPGIQLRTDSAGEIYFNSPYQMVASVTDAGVKLIAHDAFIPSGDLGEVASDGSLLLLGRANQVFKRLGEKISLAILTEAIKEVWPHEASFYLDMPVGREPEHVLVLAPAPDAVALRPVLRALRLRFARPHWPVRVEGLATLPRLANGKVNVPLLANHPEAVELWRQRLA